MRKPEDKMNQLSKYLLVAMLLLANTSSNIAQASCLKDCENTTNQTNFSTVDRTQNQQSYNRTQSHDVGDNNKSVVLGDMNINFGHNGLQISNVAPNASINNSINSTVIFGDVNQ